MVRQAHRPEPSRRANTNDQNSKFKTDRMTTRQRIRDRDVSVIGAWDLEFFCNLDIVIWVLSAIPVRPNFFYQTHFFILLRCLWHYQGDADIKTGFPAGATLNADRAPDFLHQGIGDRQAQTGSAVTGF